MSDHQELSSHHWERVADALRQSTPTEFFLGQILQWRLDVPSAMPASELSDDVIEHEIRLREARIKEDKAQIELLHEELQRRSET